MTRSTEEEIYRVHNQNRPVETLPVAVAITKATEYANFGFLFVFFLLTKTVQPGLNFDNYLNQMLGLIGMIGTRWFL